MWLEVALEVDRHRAAVEVVYRAATLEVDLQIICQLPFVGAKNRIPLPKDISSCADREKIAFMTGTVD